MNEMIHLGSIFKLQREEKKLSIREVENAISIRASYLEAIENGDLGKLISPVYAQGFIKKYASFLELDVDKLFEEHPYVMRILNQENPQNRDFSFDFGSLEVRGSPGKEVKWLPNLFWVGLSVVIILSGWFLARYFGIF